MKILLVEDENKIASFIKKGLEAECYAIDIANNGSNAVYRSEIYEYDLIILDIMLPDKDGISVCREIRSKKINVPILMLTARSKVGDKILGLDSGADDYLTKPFVFSELLARIRALLRRKSMDKTTLLKIADLELNQVAHKVKRAGKEILLTGKEYALLEYLMINAGQVITRAMISEHVWNEDFDTFTNVIDVYVNHLRNKIDKGSKQQLIHTLHHRGYILKQE
jgi:DNA-binding response OmpR family regulator